MPDAGSSRDGQLGAMVHERLRSAILSGELAAGSEIAQKDLARSLDVGRTPLREALRVLSEEGLVTAEPNRPVFIAEFSIADVEELYVMRIALEAIGMADTIPVLSPEQHGELEGLMATMTHFASRRDFPRVDPPHRRFHAMLVSAGGSRLTRSVSQLADHAERYRRAYRTWSPAPWEISMEEHRGILDAAINRDVESAIDRLTKHYLRTAGEVIRELDPEYVPERLLKHAENARIGGATRA
jgi:DNA-binding GntR family transcriptional regulator